MYGKYFLSVEAPGDDEEPAAEVEEVKPKNNKCQYTICTKFCGIVVKLFVHFDERPGAILAVWGINPTLAPSVDGRLP